MTWIVPSAVAASSGRHGPPGARGYRTQQKFKPWTSPRHEVEAYWMEYRRARGAASKPDDVCRMGDSADMGDELLQIILNGPKPATACLLRDDRDRAAKSWRRSAVMWWCSTGAATPRAIWRTKTVDVKPLDRVDDAFAWDEGEGDRTRRRLARSAHTLFREARGGGGLHVRSVHVQPCSERFAVVWRPAPDPGEAKKNAEET